MKTGLVMEGGAMRGMFTCGVIDVFLKEEITFQGAAGISAGAVFGCNFKSRQIGRAVRYNKNSVYASEIFTAGTILSVITLPIITKLTEFLTKIMG